MTRLLVTGAAGFIGANFVHYWRSAHPTDTVLALDALTYADRPRGSFASRHAAPLRAHPEAIHGVTGVAVLMGG
jgi:dTDP-glucose 4,6-dehydratase